MNRTDYRRGREAIGLLSGKRTARRAADAWPAGGAAQRRIAIGVVVGAMALTVAVLYSATPATSPTGLGPTPPPQAQAASRDFTRLLAGGTFDAGQIDLQDVRFDDWEAARAAVDFTLREPGWTPVGFWLSALQSFVPDAPGLGLAPQSVVATFSAPDGSDAYYWVDQFVIARPEEFDIASTLPVAGAEIPHGVVQVAGVSALWSGAVMTLDGTGQQLGWDRSVTVLTWADGNVGYRLEGKGVTLVDLVRVAESLG